MGSCQAEVWQSSGSRQSIIRKCSGSGCSCKTVIQSLFFSLFYSLIRSRTADAHRGNSLHCIYSHSQIFRYRRSIFCLPHRPNFLYAFDLCFHWMSVVRESGIRSKTMLHLQLACFVNILCKQIY